MRMRSMFGLFLCASLTLLAGDTKHFGQPMTLKGETPISAILANPEAFKGKRVRVKGLVTNVCEERGCYLNLKGDQKFQELMFKVDDGVIIFPASALGREAVAEGIVEVLVFSERDQKDMCPIEAKALNRKFDPAKIKGPMTVVRLAGLGAEIRF